MAVVGLCANPADWAGDDAGLLPLSGLVVEERLWEPYLERIMREVVGCCAWLIEHVCFCSWIFVDMSLSSTPGIFKLPPAEPREYGELGPRMAYCYCIGKALNRTGPRVKLSCVQVHSAVWFGEFSGEEHKVS